MAVPALSRHAQATTTSTCWRASCSGCWTNSTWQRVNVCGTSMGATSALLLAQAHPERVDRLVLRSPPPFGADMIPVRRALHALALMYRVLGVSVTARLVAWRPGDDDRARTHALRPRPTPRGDSSVPALRGFLAEPLDTARLAAIAAPTLVLTQPGERFASAPLRPGIEQPDARCGAVRRTIHAVLARPLRGPGGPARGLHRENGTASCSNLPRIGRGPSLPPGGNFRHRTSDSRHENST